MDPRKIIGVSIVMLALFIFTLSMKAAWDAYAEFRAAREIGYANELADNLIVAAGIQAIERGMTANTLGAGNRADADAGKKIDELRSAGDAAWNHALTLAHSLSLDEAGQSDFLDAIERVQQSYQSVIYARARVDVCLQTRECDITGEEWLDVIGRFIGANAHLREEAFLPLDAPRNISQLNLSLRGWVWEASEYAGRERGILAYYIGSNRPLPPAQRNELKANRALVEHSLRAIQGLEGLHSTDPRIARPIKEMEEIFLRRFESVRKQVYAGTDRGDYAISGDQWVEQSTLAINSILAIAASVSRVTDEQVKDAMRDSANHVLRHLALLTFSFLLVGFALAIVRQTANELFRQKELAEVTLRSIGDAVITTDVEARVEYLNPVAEDLTGWTTQEARGLPLRAVFNIVNALNREAEPNPVEEALREARVVGLASNTILIRRDGKEFVIEDSAAPILDHASQVIGGVLVFYDVTRMRQASHLLSFHATHDNLTGLINRREFERRLAEMLARAKNLGQRHALCYIDLDQFRVVNDTCGHAAADRMLRQLAYLLHSRVGENDTLARLGGDEFGVLMEHCRVEQALHKAEILRQAAKDLPFVHEGRAFDLSASLGLALINTDSVSVEEIMREADAACYVAKGKGGNRVQVYQPDDIELARRHGEMQWVSRISQALKEDRLCLHCQAIVPLDRSLPRHGEILVRLLDEEGNLIPPMSFIPAAERYNLMPAIDRWVIRTAFAGIGQFLETNPARGMMCSINLSGASLGEEGFEDYLREQFALHRVPPASVCFEITETAAVANLDLAATLIKALKADGCRFSLDDFGSGLSSFMYLKILPVDYLKIDGAFVKDMVNDPVAYAMVQAIHTVGHVMGIKTIAEYVENDAILEKLRELGVDYAQGFGVGKPGPFAERLPHCGQP